MADPDDKSFLSDQSEIAQIQHSDMTRIKSSDGKTAFEGPYTIVKLRGLPEYKNLPEQTKKELGKFEHEHARFVIEKSDKGAAIHQGYVFLPDNENGSAEMTFLRHINIRGPGQGKLKEEAAVLRMPLNNEYRITREAADSYLKDREAVRQRLNSPPKEKDRAEYNAPSEVVLAQALKAVSPAKNSDFVTAHPGANGAGNAIDRQKGGIS